MTNQTDQLFNNKLIVINLGLEIFAQSLEDQNVEIVRVAWHPPAGGDKEMMALLDQLL